MITDWKADILKERSIQSVFNESRKLDRSIFNKIIVFSSFVFLSIISIKWMANSDWSRSYSALSDVADIGFNLSVQILGFLIGGFAIFAVVTDSKLMIKLAQTPMGRSGISVFKNIFFNFLSVFYIYILTLAFSVFIKISMLSDIIDPWYLLGDESGDKFATIVNCLCFLVTSYLVSVCIVRLKSFIWNVYQAFLTFLIVSETISVSSSSAPPSSPAGP